MFRARGREKFNASRSRPQVFNQFNILQLTVQGPSFYRVERSAQQPTPQSHHTSQAEWVQEHLKDLLTTKFLTNEWKPPVPLGPEEPEQEMTTPPQPNLTALAWCQKTKSKAGLASLRTPDKLLRQWYDHPDLPDFKQFIDQARKDYPLDLPSSAQGNQGIKRQQTAGSSNGGDAGPAKKVVKTEQASSDMPKGALHPLSDLPTAITHQASIPGVKNTHVVVVVGQKVWLTNTDTSPRLLKKGNIISGFQSGKFWVKKPDGADPEAKDILFNLTDCTDHIMLGNAYQTVGDVIATKRAASPADAHIGYHEIRDAPTTENPGFFNMKRKFDCYFKPEPLKVKSEQEQAGGPVNIPASQLASSIPAEEWKSWATEVTWMTRWPPTASKGLQPVRPIVLMTRDLVIPQQSAVQLFRQS